MVVLQSLLSKACFSNCSCDLAGGWSTAAPEATFNSGGNGVRDVYAATYEEAAQQVVDEYYLRNGDSMLAGRAQRDMAHDGRAQAGRLAVSAREQVNVQRWLLAAQRARLSAAKWPGEGDRSCASSIAVVAHLFCTCTLALKGVRCMGGTQHARLQHLWDVDVASILVR